MTAPTETPSRVSCTLCLGRGFTTSRWVKSKLKKTKCGRCGGHGFVKAKP